VGRSIRAAFDESLAFRTHGRLTARRDSHGDAGERRRGHSEYVRIKIVAVNDVDLVLSQVPREAPHLACGMKIVEAVESKLRDLVQPEPVDLVQQHAFALQRRDEDVAVSAFDQQSR
jgi:hypothetical protein